MEEDWYESWEYDDSTPNLDKVTKAIIKMEEEPREGPRTGREMYYQYVQEGPVYQSVSGHAIASLVCSLVGFFFFGPILGTLAILLGKTALNRINDDPEEYSGAGLAISGIVIGIIDLALWVILVILIFLLVLTG